MEISLNFYAKLRTLGRDLSKLINSIYTGLVKPKKYFSYFSTKTYVVGTQTNHLNELFWSSTQNMC